MRIEEVSIDGFKSYAKRVVVGPFDSSFNAITGLNGSGKSNILDSLCFVLGIKNLATVCSDGRGFHLSAVAPHVVYSLCKRQAQRSLHVASRAHEVIAQDRTPSPRAGMQVRAGSALDLVYKQGQAGVTKAAVSVTFDNDGTNDTNKPPGYDDKKKIVVTRQARPAINCMLQSACRQAAPCMMLR